MSRIALVIGPGSMGAAVCAWLAADGFALAIADLTEAVPNRVVGELGDARHRAYVVDVADETSVTTLFDDVEEQMGPVEVVVNLAGLLIARDGEPGIAGTPVGEWHKTFGVNALGPFLVVREMLRRRKAAPKPDSRVILFSSMAAHVGGIRGSAAYSAAKASVLTLTKSAAAEGGPFGLTVNAIAPGYVESPLIRGVLKPEDDEGVIAGMPVRRLGRPADIAALVSFLAGPGSGYISGATLDINGGMHMR
jgi:3-oxoacyl-[acyl-carrier protein] reductase